MRYLLLYWWTMVGHGSLIDFIGWLPVDLDNLDSYLNVENLKLCKSQVFDSKPEWLLQIKVNLEMVFVYWPCACIANFNMHMQHAKFYFLQLPPSERPRKSCVVTTLECTNFHILIIVITRKNVVNRCWYHMTMLNGWGCHKRLSDNGKHIVIGSIGCHWMCIWVHPGARLTNVFLSISCLLNDSSQLKQNL